VAECCHSPDLFSKLTSYTSFNCKNILFSLTHSTTLFRHSIIIALCTYILSFSYSLSYTWLKKMVCVLRQQQHHQHQQFPFTERALFLILLSFTSNKNSCCWLLVIAASFIEFAREYFFALQIRVSALALLKTDRSVIRNTIKCIENWKSEWVSEREKRKSERVILQSGCFSSISSAFQLCRRISLVD
jgi:hypothetical protein